MPTIKDVAKKAGVSTMTVSRVLNEAGNVRPSTREKVMQAVDELGYVPSGVAKSLRSKRSSTLALLVPDSNNAYWMSVARGIEDAAQDRGYSVLLCNTDENVAKQRRYLDVIVGQQVDGVVIAPCDSDAENLAPLRRRRIPTVIIDRYVKGWDVDTVIGDSVSGARALTRHLAGLGHHKIAMLSGPTTTSTAADRVAGYRIALEEAGIEYDPRLLKVGEYRATSGQRLTQQLLHGGLAPTAIFAANNALLIGALGALEKRGLRVPHDLALVCFGDLPNASRLFPFLTVADFASYEMGVNAAQLLLSRLDGRVNSHARHVVLPSRLIVRQSCGSKLQSTGDPASCLWLPLPRQQETQTLVSPLGPEETRTFSRHLSGIPAELLQSDRQPSSYDLPDVNRLLAALEHREADRVPHLEFKIKSRAVYEQILGRELPAGRADAGDAAVSPEDRVELAQRLGMDAIVCDLAWDAADDRPETGGWLRTWDDLDKLEPSQSLVSQLGTLERSLSAAQDTGVGVVVSVPSFFASAIKATGTAALADSDPGSFLEAAMDVQLDYWQQVVRAVCDRFGGDLAFVLVEDDLTPAGDDLERFLAIYPQRMQRLLAPARDHGKLVALHAAGSVADLLPVLYDTGFRIVHLAQADVDLLLTIKQQWAGRLALVGGLATSLLERGSEAEIEEQVRKLCTKLAPGGGYVMCSSGAISKDVPPGNLLTMAQTVHQYGRKGDLGLAPGQIVGSDQRPGSV